MRPRLYSDARDRFELPALAVTAALVRALEARRPRARYRVTVPSKTGAVLARLLPARALDWIARRR